MSQDPIPRKRTRSETVGKDLIRDQESAVSKRQIVEDQNAHQTQQSVDKKPQNAQSAAKELKRKLKRVEQSKPKEDTQLKAQQQSKSIKAEQQAAKQRRKKHKTADKQDKRDESKSKKEKKMKKSEKHDKDDDEVKEEEEKDGLKNQKKKVGADQDQKHKSKSKKKKKDKSREKPEKPDTTKPDTTQDKPKEQQEQNNQLQKAQKKKSSEKKSKKSKKSKKDKKEKKMKKQRNQSSHDEKQSDQQDSENQSEEGTSSKKKKIKKQVKRGRGRKPIGPVKRKKASIYQQQQIINKKYRVKKKSTYINKMSDRAWGQLRAGPYRTVKKFTKAEQRLIIDSLLGDGPKKQTSNTENKSQKENTSVKIEGQNQEAVADNEEKIQAEISKSKAESSDDEPKKSKSKKKSKKKSKDDNSDKVGSTTASKKSKSAGGDQKVKVQSKSKPKKKKKDSSDSESKSQNQAKIEHGQQKQKSKSKSKKKKKKDSDSSQSSSDEKQTKGKKKSVKKDVKTQNSSKKSKAKAVKQQDHEFPKQQSQKIIDLFAVDGGNYPQMMKELPGIRLKKVRMHLRMLFHRALDIITYQVQHRCGRKIKQWEQDQRIEIVRELHRIRSSNRLLSEANAHFREKMTALMRSYNDESWLDKVTEQDIETLYRKLEAFVRGYNTINRSKRTSAASITQSKNKEKQQRYKFSKEVTRKPIICGGHLLSKSVKNQEKEEHEASEYDDRSRSMIPPQKLIEEWNREEEKTLCELYVSNQEADETICDKLKEKYGPNIKWRDFELLGRKIDQLIKYALIKLQNLTARPYSKLEREKQLLRKRAKLQLKLKKEHESQRLIYYKEKLRTTSMFLYDNEIFQKQERLEYKHRIFKNLSLLQRQIFGHIQSYKIKNSLVKILIEEFPTEEDVEEAVRQAKKFSKWAREEERKSNITSIKNVFIGERQDRDFRDDNQNEDSIMADIDKIQITRKQGFAAQTHQLSEEGDEKSVLFVESVAGRAEQPIQLENENEEVEVSDFEEPESVRSQSNEQQKSTNGGENFKMLHKLYETLNTNKPK